MAENRHFQSLANSIQAITSPFRGYLNELHEKYLPLVEGQIADYIPELAIADPNWFGISV
ncbi:MAG: glutaminase A, partial [Cyanobacteria bacterium J06632_22]